MARPRETDTQVLLDHARACFMRSGPTATLAQIADSAGVSVGTLTSRFASKAEIYERAMHAEAPVAEAIMTLAQDFREERLACLLRTAITTLRPAFASVLHAYVDPTLDDGGLRMRHALTTLEHIFERANQDGRAEIAHPGTVSQLVLSAVWGYLLLERQHAISLPVEAYAERVAATLLGNVDNASEGP